ncbi:MAG: V4R domain-containing protein [Anaerolineae bacterium]
MATDATSEPGRADRAANGILANLTWSAPEGTLAFRGVRYLLIRPETLAGMLLAFEDEAGAAAAARALYEGGFTGGRLSGRRYKDEFGLDDAGAAAFMCRMGAEIGWGRFRLIDLDSEAGRMTVEVDASPFAAAYRSLAGAPGVTAPAGGRCHLLRGVLGGLGNGLFEAAVEARETKCVAAGDDVCRFVVVAGGGPATGPGLGDEGS